MFLLGIMQFCLIAGTLFYEYKRGSLSIFLWGTSLIMFGLPHMITSFSSNTRYPAWVINEASLFVIIFVMLYLFTVALLSKSAGKYDLVESLNIKEDHIDGVQLRGIFWVFIFASSLISLIHVNRVAGGFKNATWGELLGSSSSVYDFSFSVSWFYNFTSFFVSFACCLIIVYLKEKRHILNIIMASNFIIQVLIIKEKQRILPLIIPIVVYAFIKNRKISIMTFIKGILIALIGYIIIIILSLMRSYSIESFFTAENLKLLGERISQSFINSTGELGLRNYFYTFIEHRNNYEGFGTGATYRRILLLFIPTQWSFGLKPEDFAVTMASALMGYNQKVASSHPTLFGDSYANFGVIGCVLGVLWGILVYVLEKTIVKRDNYYVRCGMAMSICNMYIMVARGSVYNSVYRYVFSCIFLAIVFWTTYFIRRNKKIVFVIHKK